LGIFTDPDPLIFDNTLRTAFTKEKQVISKGVTRAKNKQFSNDSRGQNINSSQAATSTEITEDAEME
jgi:hypothetical protein